MSLKALQGGAWLSVTPFYGTGVRHVQDSCGHRATCFGVYCVCHCRSVWKTQYEPCQSGEGIGVLAHKERTWVCAWDTG